MPVILKVEEVSKSYATEAEILPVISGLSFTLEKGKSLAVIGESGTGKSTLLNLLGGLDYVSSGGINVFDRRIEDLSETELAEYRNQYVGFVFQYHHLLPDFTALENVTLPALLQGTDNSQARELATDLLQRTGLEHRLHHKPSQLSGGEQQRIALARALINRPGLVLMDEPTGNLDEKTGKVVLDMIWKLKREYKLTLVIVTHNRDIARQTDRCLLLSGGTGEMISL